MKPKESRSPAAQEVKEKEKDRSWTKISIIFNILLFFVSAGIYWIATQQTKLASDSLESQKIQWRSDSISQHIKDSIVFSNTDSALELTRQSISLAKRNYIDENRAYVFPSTPTAKLSRFNEWILSLPIVNSGRTAAYEVGYGISFQRMPSIPDPNTSIAPISTVDLPPNHTDTLRIPQDGKYWSDEDGCKEYVVGKIWYNDYWNSRPHYASFVYRMISRYDSAFVMEVGGTDRNEKKQPKTH